MGSQTHRSRRVASQKNKRKHTKQSKFNIHIWIFPRVIRRQGKDQTDLKDRLEQQSLDFCLCTHTNVILGNTVDFMGNLLRKYSQRTTFAPDVTYLQQTSAKQKILHEQDPEGKPTAGRLAYYSAGGYTNLQLTSDFSGSVSVILLVGAIDKVLLKLSIIFCVFMQTCKLYFYSYYLFYFIKFVMSCFSVVRIPGNVANWSFSCKKVACHLAISFVHPEWSFWQPWRWNRTRGFPWKALTKSAPTGGHTVCCFLWMCWLTDKSTS